MGTTTDVEWIVGINAIEQVLEHRPEDVRCLELVDRAGGRLAALGEQAQARGINVVAVSRRDLDRRFPKERHQGAAARVAVARTYAAEDLPDLLAPPDALVLVLDQVQDPRNLGACLRSAWAAGASAVVVPKDRAAALTPAARKAAAGAAEAVPLVQVTNLARALDLMKESGAWLVGAAGGAEQAHWEVDLRGRLAIVVGSEGRGLRRLTRERCDFVVGIPMAGLAESLNVSVAAGVLLFEAIRQRSSS